MTEHSRITGLYTEAGDVELRGNVGALQHLARVLSADASPHVLALDTSRNENIVPYDHFLTAIRITHGVGLVCISRSESVLEIVGSRERLQILSENLTWLSNSTESGTEGKNHLHIEYFPDHYYLAACSLPIVVTIEDQP
jgi:hypothetical protein